VLISSIALLAHVVAILQLLSPQLLPASSLADSINVRFSGEFALYDAKALVFTNTYTVVFCFHRALLY
jgi:hypothetical protein